MSTGRPRATSRDVIAEAACELFLEQGFEGTTVADITRRAGVSRSSFFNYFTSKSDVLWAGLDERVAALATRLAADEGADASASVAASLAALGDDFAPDSLALAVVNAAAMGLDDELERDDWIPCGSLHTDVLVPARVDLWGKVLRRQGLPTALLATHPVDVSVN